MDKWRDLLTHWVEWSQLHDETGFAAALQRLIEDACNWLNADDGTIGLVDEARDAVVTAAVHRLPLDQRNRVVRRGQGLAGMVLQRRVAIQTRYGDLPSILMEEYANHRVLGFPIEHGERLIGVFCLGTHRAEGFPDSALESMQLFADMAGVAIHHWQRLQTERRRTQRFELIARVAAVVSAGTALDTTLQQTADAIHDILGYPNVDIPLIEPSDPEVLTVRIRGGEYKRRIQQIDRIPLNLGIMASAVRERRVQCVNDVQADPRYITPPGVTPPLAELCVPVIEGGDVLGVLNVEADVPFDALDTETLQLIANQLALTIRNARLHEQARQVAVLDERQKLARDLHDNVTQILSSISLLSQSIPGAMQRDPSEAQRRVRRLQELSQTGFAEMRALLNQLRPPASPGVNISRGSRILVGLEQLREHALPGALAKLASTLLPETILLKTDFAHYEPQELRLEEALYRVCQEAMSNTIRHAHAKRLWISAGVSETSARLRIADDGRGIHPEARHGIGLASMRERVQGLGGEFRILANQPQGTVLEAVVPRCDRNSKPADS